MNLIDLFGFFKSVSSRTSLSDLFTPCQIGQVELSNLFGITLLAVPRCYCTGRYLSLAIRSLLDDLNDEKTVRSRTLCVHIRERSRSAALSCVGS